MHSRNLDTNILVEPADLRTVPARDSGGTPVDGTAEESDLEELLDYNPVPPRRIVSLFVQYRPFGRGRPLPYLIKDDEE